MQIEEIESLKMVNKFSNYWITDIDNMMKGNPHIKWCLQYFNIMINHFNGYLQNLLGPLSKLLFWLSFLERILDSFIILGEVNLISGEF